MVLMAVSKSCNATLGAISVCQITLLNLNILLVAFLWRVSIAPPKDPLGQSGLYTCKTQIIYVQKKDYITRQEVHMDLGVLLDTCNWCDKGQFSADLFHTNIWPIPFTRYKASKSE